MGFARSTSHIALVSTASVFFASSLALGWEYSLSVPPNLTGRARHTTAKEIAPHPDGGIVAIGTHMSRGAVARVSETGDELWIDPFRHDLVRAVAIDGSGDVYIDSLDAIVKKSGAEGRFLWRRKFDLGRLDQRNFELIGQSDIAFEDIQATPMGRAPGITRIAGETGDVVWRSEPLFGPNGEFVQIEGLAQNGAGELLAVARYLLDPDDTSFYLYWVQTIDSDTGETVRQSPVFSGGFLFEVAAGPSNEVFVATSTTRSGAVRVGFEVKKITPAGEIIWNRFFGADGTFVVDPSGDLFVVTEAGESVVISEWVVSRLDNETGDSKWETRIPATHLGLNFADIGPQIDQGPDGDIFVGGNRGGVYSVGSIRRSGGGLFLSRLSAQTGEVLWSQDLSGTSAIWADRLNDIYADPNGDVYLAGYVSRCTDVSTSIADTLGVGFTILKVSGVDGSHVGDVPEQLPDRDGDGVPDECDNCVDVPNPALPFLDPRAQLSGGQPDQDGDGFGNVCDAKFFLDDGPVSGLDLQEVFASFGKDRDGTDCGTTQCTSCRVFDIDSLGDRISGTDLVHVLGRFGQLPGPKCERCPLPKQQGFEFVIPPRGAD